MQIEPNEISVKSEPLKTISAEKGDKVSANDEIGGSERLEPTRYGDWEKNGRCIDF